MIEKTCDRILISQYQKGDEKALTLLFIKYQKELFNFIYYKILDSDLANDFFQETFIKIITKLRKKKYNEEGKFILWAKRIAHNLIMDHFRYQTRNRIISECDQEHSIFNSIEETDKNIEERMIASQINHDLFKMINHLPENQKEVIKLRFFDGLSFKEIAEQTNSTTNTTLGRVRYALINLRKIMNKNQIILSQQ